MAINSNIPLISAARDYGFRALNHVLANRRVAGAVGGAILGSGVGLLTSDPGERFGSTVFGAAAGAGLGYGGVHALRYLRRSL